MGDHRRYLGAVGVVVLVLLAGCGGVLGGPPGEATETETTETPTETPTPTATAEEVTTSEVDVETFSYPNGTNETSLDYPVLVEEHVESLNAQSYTYSEIQEGSDGGLRIVDNVSSDDDDYVSRTYHVRNFRQENDTWNNRTMTRYWAGGQEYERMREAGNTTVNKTNSSANFTEYHDVSSGYSVGNGDYSTVLTAFDWEATEATTMLGEPVVRFETNGFTGTNETYANTSNATLHVSERGEVVRMDLYLEVTGAENGIFATYQIQRLGDVGVQEPYWIDDAS